ncbi:MAG: hypothetical protein AB1467_06255 [Candidatus Diapherotrites archaeon]
MKNHEMPMEEFYKLEDTPKNRIIDKIVRALKKEQKAMRVRHLAHKIGIQNVGMVSNVVKQHNGKEVLKKRVGKEAWVGLNPSYKPKKK